MRYPLDCVALVVGWVKGPYRRGAEDGAAGGGPMAAPGEPCGHTTDWLRVAACEHEQFEAHVDVDRLSQHEGGEVSSYLATVTIRCVGCGEPFGFRGPPTGLSWAEPRCSPDARELRLPLMDPAELELNGPLSAMARGRMTYEVRP
jgi:hypothetical protein